MINVKDQIYDALCTVSQNTSDQYPVSWEEDVSIQYIEEENRVVECTDMQEQKAYCRYRIDIWSKKSTSSIAVEVDNVLSGLGLLRTQCMDIEDQTGRKHKQMRYEMVIDVHTQQVYHQYNN
ncbi:hypothetical protein [Murimonas intestini]|uniref:hypothetical protein n=1 Tax=Murimonas intestini TaxID=1337051 RepID=UPI00248C70A5|nr:hypothetical protein [Murimonas intestini]